MNEMSLLIHSLNCLFFLEILNGMDVVYIVSWWFSLLMKGRTWVPFPLSPITSDSTVL